MVGPAAPGRANATVPVTCALFAARPDTAAAAGAAAAAAGPHPWTQKFREDIKASFLVGFSSEEEDGKAECEEERDEEEREVDEECTPLYDAETALSLDEYPELDEDVLGRMLHTEEGDKEEERTPLYDAEQYEGTMLDEDALGRLLHAMDADADGDGAARRRRWRISSKRPQTEP